LTTRIGTELLKLTSGSFTKELVFFFFFFLNVWKMKIRVGLGECLAVNSNSLRATGKGKQTQSPTCSMCNKVSQLRKQAYRTLKPRITLY